MKITLNGHRFGSLSYVYFILNMFLIPCSMKVNLTIYFFLSSQFMSFPVYLLLPNSSHTIFNVRVSSLEERPTGEVDAALISSNSSTREHLYSYRDARRRPSAAHTCGAAQSKCPERKASCRDGYISVWLPYPDPSLHLLPLDGYTTLWLPYPDLFLHLLPPPLSHRHTQKKSVSELNSE